ncbi:MAG: hypothetical protein M1829_005097 [Trizodia sp. TS-e1964]|nr:MAG: hypothetical protein M1829_005097 [Trizodia sp. TS-e1964]
MASSPPGSPQGNPQRPASMMVRPLPRSSSRMSASSKFGGGTAASDEDGKTSVKVGKISPTLPPCATRWRRPQWLMIGAFSPLAVRVRPPLKNTDPGFELIPQRFQRSMVQVTSPTSLAVDSPQGRKLFVFDRVFGENVDQEGIWEYLLESVNSFVLGYNVSMLAYGQSGAGKSYTMGTSGPAEQGDSKIMGVIPRAAIALFEKLAGGSDARASSSALRTPTRYSTNSVQTLLKAADQKWTMTATYVEIYNEHLRDLLLPESVPVHERPSVTIREDAKGRILLTGLHQVAINSIHDLLGALNFGSSIRQTDATAINAKSSRSHAVFSLNLIQRKNKAAAANAQEKRFSVPLEAMSGGDNWITIDSKYHFVDLAGSERLKNTGAQGERAKEGISINAGLASLGKVISQLSSRQAGSHVSYRDSKLTRLLQDSLGGNAITYMVACVTPAEFHLSETLNTVQYAQRARAIQSKPRIQQISDDGDKVALIERLRAEVAFLREQIRNSERGERRTNAPQERHERQNEREIDLQNQLLDSQENYTALSQRHAKLIAEMTKMGETEDLPLEGNVGDSAVERLKRSNSFAEAVEQVVLEYEKTIQTLEFSLSSTRSSLSATESSLLEKETKCAFVETVNQQLQSRVQKMMDRESSTENYLHDLEAKLDGHTSGEEKNAAIVIELRKEIARVRENEASCEDYISTLEERLAEADQDVELMQREIERLEHIIERQRSLGKLDHLLYELDHIHNDERKSEVGEHGDGPLSKNNVDDETRGRSRGISTVTSVATNGHNQDDHSDHISNHEKELENDDPPHTNGELKDTTNLSTPAVEIEYPQQSPAQSKFVAEKLQNVTQELFDLKMEHETTVNEYDNLSAKYQEALQLLASLRESIDESRGLHNESIASPSSTRPTSFLDHQRMSNPRDGEQLLSPQSLSSELSLVGESSNARDISDVDTAITRPSTHEDVLYFEMENLKRLQIEREDNIALLSKQYSELQEQHYDTLDYVEELKAEVQKAKMNSATSPTSGPVIRRKSSQNVMIIDRAHRSFASLRNIAAENFEDRPDVMQNFEVNLNTAMHELHARSERVQELEADNASVKKEMETKMAIISGLTRERSSLKNSSPINMSVVSEKIMQGEQHIKVLQETHSAREQELLSEIATLRSSVQNRELPSPTAKQVASSEPESSADIIQISNDYEKKISALQSELEGWEERHKSASSLLKASETRLHETIAELETAMASVEKLREESSKETHLVREEKDAQLEQQRQLHQETVDSLRREIDQHQSTIVVHLGQLAALQKSHDELSDQYDEAVKSREMFDADLGQHRQMVTNLQEQIEEHELTIQAHQDSLKSLHESHAVEKENLRTSTLAIALAEGDARLKEVSSIHSETMDALQSELSSAKAEMETLAERLALALDKDMSANTTDARIFAMNMVEDVDFLHRQQATLQQQISAHEKTIMDLTTLSETTMDELDRLKMQTGRVRELEEENVKVKEQHEKDIRIIEGLEEQLASNYDQHEAANHRFSTLQTERNASIEEANAAKFKAQSELDALREEMNVLQGKLGIDSEGRQRSGSVSSVLRKSASVASLPSPPPAIPLPPLPNGAANASSQPGVVPGSPTGSRHPSKEINTQHVEDQEARIRTIEKHLSAEKQLTHTLEEALTDLERQGNESRKNVEMWKKKCKELEDEVRRLETRPASTRWSMQAVDAERKARVEAEAARAHLEERMNAINKKKKKSALNCF